MDRGGQLQRDCMKISGTIKQKEEVCKRGLSMNSCTLNHVTGMCNCGSEVQIDSDEQEATCEDSGKVVQEW